MFSRKIFLFILLSYSVVHFSYGQAKSIRYGDNAAAGRYYSIRGCKLYTEIYGHGPALLLIHGNGGSISAFNGTIPYFSRKYKVIAVDSRAHGRSTDNNDSLSFEQMADDFAVLLDSLHIDSAYVLGWSDGGINALVLAMRHPEKVIKLASTGANLWPDSTALIPSYVQDEIRKYNEQKNNERVTVKSKNDWKVFLLDFFQPNIPLSALQTIRCPSLVISGDRDLIRLEHTLLIYQHIPGADLWIMPHCGHDTPVEYRNEFNCKVNEFFMSKK